jgi:RimJ/RimL family protein N-acetyltransferase
MLRQVTEPDLAIFYAHQRDPRACEVCVFTPRDEPTFFTHWRTKVLVGTNLVRTIVHDEQVVGYVSSYAMGDERFIAYWIGREFWGRGLASGALREFVKSVDTHRPLEAIVATSNVGSIRVLEKAGFTPVPNSRAVSDGVEEIGYRLK